MAKVKQKAAIVVSMYISQQFDTELEIDDITNEVGALTHPVGKAAVGSHYSICLKGVSDDQVKTLPEFVFRELNSVAKLVMAQLASAHAQNVNNIVRPTVGDLETHDLGDPNKPPDSNEVN